MSLSPGYPPALPPAKSKLSAEERRARYADLLITIRLRMLIIQELGRPRHHHPVLLQAVAARLGVQAPGP